MSSESIAGFYPEINNLSIYFSQKNDYNKLDNRLSPVSKKQKECTLYKGVYTLL